MEHIPVQENTQVQNTYYVKEKRFIGSGVLLDWVATSVLIALMLFVSASYFVNFSGEFEVGVKKAAVDTAWVAFAVLCVKELAKHVFKRKGQRTEEYANAKENAKKAIKKLNLTVDSKKVEEYCAEVTKNTIERYRKHQLSTVGLTLEDFNNQYLGEGSFALIGKVLCRKLSLMKARAIWRCNHIKTKPYNPSFITSYNAENNTELVPSQQNDARQEAFRGTAKSLFATVFSSFGVGVMFSDIFLNFTSEMIFLAIIKIILLIVSFALSAMFGWNLSLIEQARNETREREAYACMKYAGVKE